MPGASGNKKFHPGELKNETHGRAGLIKTTFTGPSGFLENSRHILSQGFSLPKLLFGTLPVIARYTIFALKGSTAINFFIRDLYGGKICAALDHQHQRYLFDVGLLLETKALPIR